MVSSQPELSDRIVRGARSRRGSALLLCISLIAGCATAPRQDIAPYIPDPDLVRNVAIVAASSAPNVTLSGYARSKGDGAATLAKKGLSGCGELLLGGAQGCGGDAFCGLLLLAIGGGCLVLAPPVGGIIGALRAPSEETVAQNEQAIMGAIESRALQELLRTSVEQAATASGSTVYVLPADARPTTSAEHTYPAFAGLGLDSVLETDLHTIATVGEGINTPSQLLMGASVRIVSLADNEARYHNAFQYRGERYDLQGWGGAGAAAFVRELERGYRNLATQIAETVFMLYPFPSRDPRWEVGPMGFSGLEPRDPKPDHSALGRVPEVYTLTPTLRWEAFPRSVDTAVAPEETARVKNVAYDIEVARDTTPQPGTAFYSRSRLPQPEHRLETVLEPATAYLWRVRARFELDGRQRVTEWAAASCAPRRGQTCAPTEYWAPFRTRH
ncbi:MAG: hypothetical protein FIB06_02735 [Betaproteobacteria bacterium]|nr:hypothetical protein [Betaproteobacteria bacterium]